MIAPCTNRGHHFYIPLLDTVFDNHFHTSEPYRAVWGKGCVLQVCHFKTLSIYYSSPHSLLPGVLFLCLYTPLHLKVFSLKIIIWVPLKSLEGKRKTGSLFIFVTHYINTINIQENKQKYIIMVEGKPKPETRGLKGPGSLSLCENR